MSIILAITAGYMSIEWLKAVTGESPNANAFWLSAGTAFIWILCLFTVYKCP